MKVKKNVYTILFSFIFLSANAQTGGIQFFNGSWKQALAKATKENRPIFMDCYASWCLPCKKLAKDVFVQDEMGHYFNKSFINVQMNMEQGAGKKKNVEYGIKSYPTLLVLNSHGFKVAELVGYQKGETLISWAKEALLKISEVTPDEQIIKGQADDAFIHEYFKTLLSTNQQQKAEDVFNDIFKSKGAKIFSRKIYWDLLSLSMPDASPMLYVVKNKEQLYKFYGKNAVNEKIRDSYVTLRNFRSLFKMPVLLGVDSVQYAAYIQKLESRKIPDRKFIEAELNVYAACLKKDFKGAFQIGDKQLKGATAWQYYEMARLVNWAFVLKEYRNLAVSWAKKAVELETLASKKTLYQKVLDELKDRSFGSFYPTPSVWGLTVY